MNVSGNDMDSVYRMIFEQAPLAVIMADPKGTIRLWNKGAKEIFGWSAEEALGQSMDLIIPEKHREKHWSGYASVMETGNTKYGHDLLAVPARKKDGGRISVEFYVVLLKDFQGEIIGVAALLQDITARWDREKQMLQRLVAAEAMCK